MCQPLLTLAFCAIFSPTPATAAAPASAEARSAAATSEATAAHHSAPAWESLPAATKLDRPYSPGDPLGARAGDATLVAADSSASSREAAAYRREADTETKGGEASAQGESGPEVTEQK
jgi:hypothetical protein